MSFNSIIGQDVAIKSLENIIAKDQVRGAYLFLGPEGVGKRTAAIELAKAINCEKGDRDSCNECIPCSKIGAMNHPDVFVVSPEKGSSIKIDDIRGMTYQASLKPYEAKKRVFIINDAEEMTEQAQNAFLKLLEEPPQNHILILVASNISALLPTIVSRCKVLKFYSLKAGDIQEILQGRDIEDTEVILFSHMAMGSAGRALRFKEEGFVSRREELVRNFFLRKSVLLREDMLNEEISEDVEESLFILLCWYRDLLISKFTGDVKGLFNIDRADEIFSYAGRFSEAKLQKDILNIMKTMDYFRRNLNPKIALFNLAVALKGA